MAYVTHQQLAERPGARELAQVASDEHQPPVLDELMELALTGGDRSDWTPEQNALVDSALARIDDAVADADGLIDGFLRQGGYQAPIEPPPRLITVWSRAIARYYLHRHRHSLQEGDPVVRDYKDALALLQQVAAGSLSIGVGAASGVDVPLAGPPRRLIRQALRDY